MNDQNFDLIIQHHNHLLESNGYKDHRLVRYINHGSYGYVFQFSDGITDRLAVKINRADSTSEINIENKMACHTEMHFFKTMKHPNVLRAKKMIKLRGYVYLVLPLLPYTLFEFVCSKDWLTLPPETKEYNLFYIAYYTSRALNYVHSYNIAHLDLKLENILIDIDS
jgi:serine/threonine-protein kinase HSL1 (negative regulator of Swe1 kinase)